MIKSEASCFVGAEFAYYLCSAIEAKAYGKTIVRQKESLENGMAIVRGA
jgi:hypothetical protein